MDPLPAAQGKHLRVFRDGESVSTKASCGYCGEERSAGWIARHEFTCVARLTIEDLWRIGNIEISDGGCWLWKPYGYVLDYPKYKGRKLSRWMWELHNEKELGDLLACHSCDNPPCINPEHIFAGTHLDNSQDASAKGRMTGPRYGQASGDKHWSRRMPERMSRGDSHYTRTRPESVPRGENHWTAKQGTDALKNNHWSKDPEKKAAVMKKILETKRRKGMVK